MEEPNTCDECGKELPEAPQEMYWWEELFFFCSRRCRVVWHMKQIAAQNGVALREKSHASKT